MDKPCILPVIILLTEKKEEIKRYGPSVRKIIEKNEINVESISGSGRKGRVYKKDLEIKDQRVQENKESDKKFMSEVLTKNDSATISIQENSAENISKKDITSEKLSSNLESEVPMSKLRISIVKNLLKAQHNSLVSTIFDEVNMESIVSMRELYKERFLEIHNVRLSFTSFFVKSVAQALKSFPSINSSIKKDAVFYHRQFNVGLTIDSPNGLVTPVIQDADSASIVDIEKKILEFSEKAKNGKLSLEDMSSGTFTITNGGFPGSMLSTSVINYPQNAILSTHKIADRPYIVQGDIKVKPIMYITLSYNYCVVDNKCSASFLLKVKELLENPYLLLLET